MLPPYRDTGPNPKRSSGSKSGALSHRLARINSGLHETAKRRTAGPALEYSIHLTPTTILDMGVRRAVTGWAGNRAFHGLDLSYTIAALAALMIGMEGAAHEATQSDASTKSLPRV
jgi:hypothetical protein